MRRTGRRVPSRVLWVVSVLILAGCDAKPIPLDLGIPLELAEHRQRTISGLRYRISLEIPAEKTTPIRGRTLMSFAWQDPDEQPLVIDFLEPGSRVHEVSVNGSEALWEPVEDHIVIPASALREGMNEVVVTFDAGDEALNRSSDFMYALFVPDRAHFSLPLFDQPNLKAPVRWTVTAPADWKVIANGPGGEESIYPDRIVHSFQESRPIPTYLFAVAAGRFEEETEIIGGRVFRMFHRETDSAKVARNKDEIFALHAAAVDWLEEYTGIEYPFQKFAFVLIPSFQYGGMEHPGGILYRQAGLMLDESATQGRILGRASVIAHETAHMWFGDLVTMNWFDDVWTKEVFANFMAAKIVQPSFPEVDHDLRFLTAHYPTAYGVDRTEGANPIRQPLENLRFAGTLYGSIIYQKAPVVMRHLEARVGEQDFRDGLRVYLDRYAYGNATWPDLISILDERSPENLSEWSRVWVEEPGRPTIRVSRDGDDVVVRSDDPAGQGRVWPQTLGVRFGSAEADEVRTIELGADPVRIEGAGTARFILPNGTGLEYGGFTLDPESQDYLLTALPDFSDAVTRGAAWVTLWDQLLERRLEPTAFLDAALTALEREQNELIIGRLLGYVSTLFWRLTPADERIRVGTRIESLLWREANGDRPRRARASFLSSYRGLATTEDAVVRLTALWSGDEQVRELPLSESDETSLASRLAILGVANADSILDAQAARIENPDRRARFDFVRPSLSSDPRVREAFFESLRDPANREHEPWALAGLGNLHHPLRADASIHLIEPALAMVGEIQRTGDIFFPGRWLGAVLGGHSSPEAAEIVETFLANTPELSPRLRLKVLQSADMVLRSALIVHGG